MSARYPGWTRLSQAGAKLDALWQHDATGWQVQHCGHPTANYPYYAVPPPKLQDGYVVVAANGRGFRTLAIAFESIDGLVAGRYELTRPPAAAAQTEGDRGPRRVTPPQPQEASA